MNFPKKQRNSRKEELYERLEPEERDSLLESSATNDEEEAQRAALSSSNLVSSNSLSAPSTSGLHSSSGKQDRHAHHNKEPQLRVTKASISLAEESNRHKLVARRQPAAEHTPTLSRAANTAGCCCCLFSQTGSSSSPTDSHSQPASHRMGPKMGRLMAAIFVAELLGTFLVVIIGDGAIATYVLTRRDVNVFVACFAFGVGVMIATFTTMRISGAHMNPAATVAFALEGKVRWTLVPIYLAAQYLGGFLAATALYFNSRAAIDTLDGGVRSAFGSTNSTGHIFSTYPGVWVTPLAGLLDQILGTAVLLFSQCAIADRNNLGLEDRHQPLILAFLVGMICVSFNANCGAIFNPARDLAPRLLTYVVGYPLVWAPVDGYYWLTAGLLGPHMGAAVGVFTYKLLIGGALAGKRDHEIQALSLEAKQQRSGQQQLAKLAGHHQNQNQQGARTGGTTGAELAGYGAAHHHHNP